MNTSTSTPRVYIVETCDKGIENVFDSLEIAKNYLWTVYMHRYLDHVIKSAEHAASACNLSELLVRDWETLNGEGYIEDIGYITFDLI